MPDYRKTLTYVPQITKLKYKKCLGSMGLRSPLHTLSHLLKRSDTILKQLGYKQKQYDRVTLFRQKKLRHLKGTHLTFHVIFLIDVCITKHYDDFQRFVSESFPDFCNALIVTPWVVLYLNFSLSLFVHIEETVSRFFTRNIKQPCNFFLINLLFTLHMARLALHSHSTRTIFSWTWMKSKAHSSPQSLF